MTNAEFDDLVAALAENPSIDGQEWFGVWTPTVRVLVDTLRAEWQLSEERRQWIGANFQNTDQSDGGNCVECGVYDDRPDTPTVGDFRHAEWCSVPRLTAPPSPAVGTDDDPF